MAGKITATQPGYLGKRFTCVHAYDPVLKESLGKEHVLLRFSGKGMRTAFPASFFIGKEGKALTAGLKKTCTTITITTCGYGNEGIDPEERDRTGGIAQGIAKKYGYKLRREI